MTQSNQFDLSIFANLESNACNTVSNNNNTKLLGNCDHLDRIGVAMKYYEQFSKNKIDKEEFIKFCLETYCNFLDDYCHFIKVHDIHFNEIKKELESKYSLRQCDLTECEIVDRHYRHDGATGQNQDNDDIEYTYFVDCFDRMHHHLFHLETMGLRIPTTSKIKEEMKDGDQVFNEMKKTIFLRRNKFLSNRDIPRLQNTKFNLNTGSDEESQTGLHWFAKIMLISNQYFLPNKKKKPF